ncbi:hypothetical protein ABFX02_11G113600 [Erythranthe guttata]
MKAVHPLLSIYPSAFFSFDTTKTQITSLTTNIYTYIYIHTHIHIYIPLQEHLFLIFLTLKVQQLLNYLQQQIMSAKMMSSLSDENRNIQKQIGCMNGLLQLFDRRHFLTPRRSHKKLLLGSQQQLESHNATKPVMEKPRLSTESSSQATSYSSSSCSSSAFSSLDQNRKPKQTQTQTPSNRQKTDISQKTQFSVKEKQQLKKTPDIRDLVKDSMHREARGVNIKSFSSQERKVTVMKHMDSPRPFTLARFSYDGRESRDSFKTAMKLKELPRLSLDSKKTSLPLEPRSLTSRVLPLDQESGGHSHSRSSSIVAKLMGLEDSFPDSTISTDENFITKTNSKSNSKVSVRKSTTCSRIPVEPAPWKQQKCGQKTSLQSKKASKNIPHPSSSVYGEIEKRITELEFKRSGKDLRALKQILEAMQKTRVRLEESQTPKVNVPEMGTPKLQVRQIQDPKYRRNNNNNPAHGEKAKDVSPRTYTKKDAWKNQERARASENCTTSGSGFGAVGPRSQRNILTAVGESRTNTSSLEPSRVRKHISSKKVTEKFHQNRKQKVKSTDSQLSDDQLSELSSETRQSSYHGDTASIKSEHMSDIETEVLSSINTNTREQQNSVSPPKEHMSAVEQPSPVSVLDSTFYGEDSPSPVKNISTPFRDESPSPDEAEWHVENLNHSTHFTKYEKNETAVNHNGPVYWSLDPSHGYINKILQASKLLEDTTPTANQLLSSCPLINPDVFHALEETEDPLEEANGEFTEKNNQIKLNQKIDRKIVFDAVNEMLVRKITSGRFFTLGRERVGMKELVKEVYSEMDNLCRMPYCNVDDNDDGSIGLVTADMKYRSDEWTDRSCEFSGLVLDIERQIFKDLINEVVIGEVMSLSDWPKRHSRQLFN